MLKELTENKISIKKLVNKYKITKKYHRLIDEENIKNKLSQHRLTQVQIVRQGILDLSHNKWWGFRKQENWQKPLIPLKEKIRKELSNSDNIFSEDIS